MVSVKGRERLRAKFRRMPEKVRAAVVGTLPLAADDLVAMQKRLAPHDKGNLRESIRKEAFENQDDAYRIKVVAGGTAATRRVVREGSGKVIDEAVLIEFGTKKHKAGGKFAGARIPDQPPRPFFFPAYRALKRRIKSKIARAISKAVKES